MRLSLNFHRFLDFGRGKNVPITPDGDNPDKFIKSNTGRIVVDKTITEFGLKHNIFSSNLTDSDDGNSRFVIDKNGKITECKKKGRFNSLDGNVPKRQSQLVRLKTVGTFNLCMEVTSLACGFDQEMMNPGNEAPSAAEKIKQTTNAGNEVEVKNPDYGSLSISPKRQIHISSSENSLIVDDSSINSNSAKKFRSLSTNSYLLNRDNVEGRSKSADFLDKAEESFETILTNACSDSDLKEANAICESFINTSDVEVKHSDVDDGGLSSSSNAHADISITRRKTFKKSKKIIRTDSELFKEQILSSDVDSNSPAKKPFSIHASKTNSIENSQGNSSVDEHHAHRLTSMEDSSKNISTDTVFSDNCDFDEQIDLEQLETEYKEHIKSNLQREYKSDGDSLDEVGKKRHHYGKWKNQSVDFNFLEDGTCDTFHNATDANYTNDVLTDLKKIRNDCEKRTKSEGDKDFLYIEKTDSIETQSTEDDRKNDSDQQSENPKVEKQSLFEKRFGKLKKMNKLLKVKRFSTSALYDKKKDLDTLKSKNGNPQLIYPPSGDVCSSKMSLTSPKSLKGKKFLLMKKRKFSFFGKSQSNNDLNLNLKSLASKLSLLSKSNWDISNKTTSNLKLNTVGVAGKYGASNEYRSDILTRQKQCSSPLSEAFFNSTGSYQLTAMELFEKFCSQEFTGLYKHEVINEDDDNEFSESVTNSSYKGAIKKTSLRKASLLKQNSEPKFNIRQTDQSYYANPQDAFEEEETEEVEDVRIIRNEAEDYEYEMNSTAAERRRFSLGRQLEFDQNDQYFDDPGDSYYISEDPEIYGNNDGDIDEIYLMPEKQRYDGTFSRNSDDILAIDETDEECLEDEENVLQIPLYADSDESDQIFNDKGKLISLYEICPRDEEFSEAESTEDKSSNLKIIISDYVKNSCMPNEHSFSRAKSMEILSNSSETIKTNSNSEYAFDTVRQLHLDSCSTSKLSLSLNSDIFDDITLAPPLETGIKTIKICEMDDFTITPDGSSAETEETIAKLSMQMSEEERIKNELQSQYTIIDCDELEYDNDIQRFNTDKSSFAEALNKEFDKLFSRIKNDSDTDVTYDTTPSIATTIQTAIKLPSRCSMEKLEPYALELEHDNSNVVDNSNENIENKSTKLISQSLTSATLNQSLSSTAPKKDEPKSKSKRSHSLGNIHKRKSNKCTPL